MPIWVGFFGVNAIKADIITYHYPKKFQASTDYRVTAGNKNIFTYKTPVFSMAAFAFDGEADVVVDVGRPIKHPLVRPLSLGIKPSVAGNRLRFRISRPCHLAMEVDEDLHRPLFLFADAPETNAPGPGDPNVLYFAEGRIHEAGTIQLKNNQTVYLAGGAVVRGLIRGENVSGVRILGAGILDGSTRVKWEKMVVFNKCRDIEISGPIMLGSYGWTINPFLSEDIRLDNVKILGWRDNDDGFDPDSTKRVTVNNCFFRTKDDCIAVKAHGNFGLPGSSKEDQNRYNTENVTVMNSTFWSSEWGHALTVGAAIRAPRVSNILFTNCDIIKKEKGWAMSIDNTDLGAVEDVRFENIRVEDGCDKLLALNVLFNEYSADCPVEYFRNNEKRKPAKGEDWAKVVSGKRISKRGFIRGVVFKDIQITGDRLPLMSIQGWNAAADISDVLFENVTLGSRILKFPAEENLQIQNAGNVRFE